MKKHYYFKPDYDLRPDETKERSRIMKAIWRDKQWVKDNPFMAEMRDKARKMRARVRPYVEYPDLRQADVIAYEPIGTVY